MLARLAAAPLLVAAATALSGCEALCDTGTGIGVFCPETLRNPLNDSPVVEGGIVISPTPCDDRLPIETPVTFSLRDVADPDGDPLFYEWDLDGDGDFETERERPTIRYTAPGVRQVRVRVTDFPANLGAPGTVERTARLVVIDRERNQPTHVAFTASAPAVVGHPVAFDASATTDPDIVDSDDFNYQWDFGDGSFNPHPNRLEPGLRTVTHTYRQPGEYTVELTVSECFGDSASARQRIVVVPPSPSDRAPTARFTFSPAAPLAGEVVTLDGSASEDPNGRIVRYEWDLDGDGSYDRSGSGPITTTTFQQPGEHVVRLRVTDDEGLVSANPGSITVGENRPPTASFFFTPFVPFVNRSIEFDASASSDREGPIARYEWDFDGNGSFETDSGANPVTTRSYATPGERFVRLRVTDRQGLTAITGRTVNVLPAAAPRAIAARTNTTVAFVARLRGSRVARGKVGRRALAGVLGRGRLRARMIGPPGRATAAERMLARFLKARWRTRVGFRLDRRTRRWSAGALALARAGRARACLRIRLTDRPGRPAGGRVRVLGGGRLRGDGTVRFRLERDGSATVVGQLRVRTGKPRPLPRGCRRLATRTG